MVINLVNKDEMDKMDKILGILGGMGPLASAEFVKTIYEYNIAGDKEQTAPRIILILPFLIEQVFCSKGIMIYC